MSCLLGVRVRVSGLTRKRRRRCFAVWDDASRHCTGDNFCVRAGQSTGSRSPEGVNSIITMTTIMATSSSTSTSTSSSSIGSCSPD